jgi:hypothetical protein
VGRRDDVDTHREEVDGRHPQSWNDLVAYHASLSQQKKASGLGWDDGDWNWTFLFLLGSGSCYWMRMNARGLIWLVKAVDLSFAMTTKIVRMDDSTDFFVLLINVITVCA